MRLKVGAMLPEVFRHLFRKPATVECPFVAVPAAPNYRGTPVVDANKCIGCTRCVKDCPAEALELKKEFEFTNEQGKNVRKFSMTLYIDRCSHCAQCVESCSVDAISMDANYTHPAFNREALKVVYMPDRPANAQPPSPEPEKVT